MLSSRLILPRSILSGTKNDNAVAGLKLASATSSPTAEATTNRNFVFTGRGCVALVAPIASKPPKCSVPPMMAPLNSCSARLLPQPEVVPELIALLVAWMTSTMRGESLRACACLRALFVARRKTATY